MRSLLDAIGHLFRSFGYAGRGIAQAVQSQMNLRVHLVALVTVGIVGFALRLKADHWCMVLLCCMAVISLELVNTALEKACDAVTRENHPLIGQAKDACAGAVLVSAIGSVVIAMLILFGGGYHLRLMELWRHCGWMKPSAAVYILLAGAFVFGPYMKQMKKK
ncbi:MAG: diacylglycerol kinase family protein [Oscillospiraceae bacterium]|nr:diacylglycerol kinase family protein [Oscillospiraceae bacterium]